MSTLFLSLEVSSMTLSDVIILSVAPWCSKSRPLFSHLTVFAGANNNVVGPPGCVFIFLNMIDKSPTNMPCHPLMILRLLRPGRPDLCVSLSWLSMVILNYLCDSEYELCGKLCQFIL
ncbi:hypothetical protein EV702DRAFT_1149177 [Suillus placidus]|uniref:Uncharacterized protein n=1 Tax=Suillus placidus TaxID=48579 RepID=A0A9P6ZJN0_9AGAM|nr:hypothetical protein EV702DRAFT_1149177 [Suillus placidus]